MSHQMAVLGKWAICPLGFSVPAATTSSSATARKQLARKMLDDIREEH
jgi:hypothetical protein